MTKRRNLLVVIITLIFVSIALTGCDDSDHESKDIKDEVKEETVYEGVAPLILISKEKIEGSDLKQQTYYDPETMIMFVHYINCNDKGISVMHNADGTPRIYDGTSEVKPLILISKEKIKDAGSTQYTFYDPETLVMYVRYTNMNCYGISEMPSPDGNLRTYNPKK